MIVLRSKEANREERGAKSAQQTPNRGGPNARLAVLEFPKKDPREKVLD